MMECLCEAGDITKAIKGSPAENWHSFDDLPENLRPVYLDRSKDGKTYVANPAYCYGTRRRGVLGEYMGAQGLQVGSLRKEHGCWCDVWSEPVPYIITIKQVKEGFELEEEKELPHRLLVTGVKIPEAAHLLPK